MNSTTSGNPPGAADPRAVLFTPIRIGTVTAPNRVVLGPVAAHAPTPDGAVTDETVAFFTRRAQGGVGMIIVGSSIATGRGWDGAMVTRYFLRFDREEFVPGLRRLTAAVHAHGVPLFAQINTSMGRMGKPGPAFISASAVNVHIPEASLRGILGIPGGITTPPPRPATVEEIRALLAETVESVERMRRAGFDGVEIGAHMSYFIASFLTPRTNQRDDAYGGSRDNRARVLLELIAAIRARVGRDYPVGVRMTANEHTPGGQGAEEYSEIARLLEAAGCDYIALSDGAYESLNRSVAGKGSMVELGEARQFRAKLSIPVLLGGIHDPDAAAAAIAGGHGDLCMLVRPMLADPDYALKVREGRSADIAACNQDNQCLRRLMLGLPIRCPVNPQLGSEATAQQLGSRVGRWLASPFESLVLRISAMPRVMKFMAGRAAVRAAPGANGERHSS